MSHNARSIFISHLPNEHIRQLTKTLKVFCIISYTKSLYNKIFGHSELYGMTDENDQTNCINTFFPVRFDHRKIIYRVPQRSKLFYGRHIARINIPWRPEGWKTKVY